MTKITTVIYYILKLFEVLYSIFKRGFLSSSNNNCIWYLENFIYLWLQRFFNIKINVYFNTFNIEIHNEN